MSIGGNLYATLQVKKKTGNNRIGEGVRDWVDCGQVLGWLDLSTGDSNRLNFYAKIEESTHIFLCDYSAWAEQEPIAQLTSEEARMIINGLVYEIMLIDNPMQMNEHLEIYLRFVGGQNEC